MKLLVRLYCFLVRTLFQKLNFGPVRCMGITNLFQASPEENKKILMDFLEDFPEDEITMDEILMESPPLELNSLELKKLEIRYPVFSTIDHLKPMEVSSSLSLNPFSAGSFKLGGLQNTNCKDQWWLNGEKIVGCTTR